MVFQTQTGVCSFQNNENPKYLLTTEPFQNGCGSGIISKFFVQLIICSFLKDTEGHFFLGI